MNTLSIHHQTLLKQIQSDGNYPSEDAVLDDALKFLQQRTRLKKSLETASQDIKEGRGLSMEELQAELEI